MSKLNKAQMEYAEDRLARIFNDRIRQLEYSARESVREQIANNPKIREIDVAYRETQELLNPINAKLRDLESERRKIESAISNLNVVQTELTALKKQWTDILDKLFLGDSLEALNTIRELEAGVK